MVLLITNKFRLIYINFHCSDSSEMYSAMNNKRSKPSDEQQYSSASPKAVLTEQQSSNVHGAKTTSTNKKIEKMVVSVEGEPKKNIQRIIDDETGKF